jgi:S-adenosylmethionine:diacylglycerol 3-amino-3-carboxypropyl transferase
MLPRRRPLYSADNEDSRSELRALAPGDGDCVVCVAAGGGRALSLLSAGAARFLAVDRRPSQLHTLELKAAALDALSYPELRRFVGVDPDAGRLDAFLRLRGSLTRAARRYWDARSRFVRDGILYAGRLETWLARCTSTLRIAGVFTWPADCFAAKDLSEQRLVLARLDDEVARGEAPFAACMHPVVVWLATQDPSFLRSSEGNPGRVLYRRFTAFAARHPLRESFLLQLIWTGRYDADSELPLWLTREGGEQARKHLARMQLVCADLAALPAQIGRRDPSCWSLSDVSCWMGEARFHALLRAIAASSLPGSRLCFRNLAARRRLPADEQRLRRLDALCDTLDRDDRSAFYRFEAAEVV